MPGWEAPLLLLLLPPLASGELESAAGKAGVRTHCGRQHNLASRQDKLSLQHDHAIQSFLLPLTHQRPL